LEANINGKQQQQQQNKDLEKIKTTGANVR